MSSRRGVSDWLKSIISWLAALAASAVFRECCRRLFRWIEEMRDS